MSCEVAAHANYGTWSIDFDFNHLIFKMKTNKIQKLSLSIQI